MKNDNLIKFNELRKKAGRPKGRKSFAKTLEIYVKQYLNSDASVRHFKKWADQKPGEALPWAWKVVYGDGNGTLGPQKGQVNVLISILTGRNTTPLLVEPADVPRGTLPSPEGQENTDTQDIVCQSSNSQAIVVPVAIPENPENR